MLSSFLVLIGQIILEKHRVRRYHRADFAREVQLFLDSETTIHGLTRDLSTDSVSIFVSLKGAKEFFSDVLSDDGQLKLSALKKKFIGGTLLVSINDTSLREPINLKVLRVEISWQKGYDIFLAGKFQNLDDFQTKELEKACPSVLVRQETDQHYSSSTLPTFKSKLESDPSLQFIHLEYTSSYANVRSTRDYIANLADRHEFNEEEVYQIKLMVDELLMNAFLYGSTEKDRNHSNIKLHIGQPGMIIEVTDHGGNHFNDRPYHLRRDVRSGPVGGLALIEAYSDDWQVDIHREKFTRVTFFKTRSEETESP
jgi:anti-sigma regulatory factor (Ser/Thr protein kinase)